MEKQKSALTPYLVVVGSLLLLLASVLLYISYTVPVRTGNLSGYGAALYWVFGMISATFGIIILGLLLVGRVANIRAKKK